MKIKIPKVGIIVFFMFFFNSLFAQNSITFYENDAKTIDRNAKFGFTEKTAFRKMIDLYKTKRQHRVHKKVGVFGGHKDAYNVWFKGEQILKFIENAKKIAAAENNEFTGLRFYYAVYPRKKTAKGFIFSHTVVIVATEKCKDGNKCREIHDIVRNNKIFIMDIDPLAMNNGTLCPPLNNCDGCEF